MRVLHVVDGNLPHLDTWAAFRARNVACAQLSLGFDPKVLAMGPPSTNQVAGADEPLREVEIERLGFVPDGGAEKAGWGDRAVFFHRASRRVRGMVQREEIQLVHVYGHATVALASLLGGHQAEVPVVYEPAVSRLSPDQVAGWALGNFDAVVTPSLAQSEAWSQQSGRTPVHYVPDGIDLSRLREVQPVPTDLAFVIAPLFDAEPDLRGLQAALSREPELSRSASFWVGSPALRDRLRVEWGLPPARVRTFGPSLEALGAAAVDATALLYLAEVPQGTSFEVLTAAAQGRPVIAYRHPGLAELVRDGVSGRLVPRGDERELARALSEVVTRAEDMGRALRRDVVRSRNWMLTAESYFEIYDAARRRGPGGGTLNQMAQRLRRRLRAR